MVAPPSTGGNPPQQQGAAKAAPSTRLNGMIPPSAPPTIPYSARKAAPLDMKTVERRNNPPTRDYPPRNRPHSLAEAPTYRPTEEEFRDPMEYIKSISAEASKCGICKIIPPDSWDPEFAIDLEKFHFRTRRQELNSVEGGTRANLNYLDQLAMFHKQYGTNLNRFPSVDKRPLDLYKLKKAVEVRGGFERVCKDKKWAEIGRDLGYSGKIMSSLSTSLKNSYQRWLHPYEDYLRTAKPALEVHQTEFDTGKPYTPPSGHMGMPEPMPNSAGPFFVANDVSSSQAPPPPTTSFGSGPGYSVQPGVQPPVQTPVPVMENNRPISSGFTAVNGGGFAAVNAPSGFVAVNNNFQPPFKQEGEVNGLPPGVHHVAPHAHANAAQPVLGMTVLMNGNGIGANPLKRAMSQDSLNGEYSSDGVNGDDDSGSGRRSKRIKKDIAPTIAGSHVNSLRPLTPRPRIRSETRKTAEKCDQCGKSEDKENIIVCESCNQGFHKYCVNPPLRAMPDYEWNCPKCLVGTGEYGFEEGGIYSLKVFQEKAKNFKEHYFASKFPPDPITNSRKEPTEDDVEREFWRLVESLTETVEVEYGADIHSTTHGSGFPTIEKNPLNPYSKSPWNLNVLPFHEESLFRHIKTDISGMTVPWLYVGMCFSTFCWHNEDHYTYSANYQHFGATKTWYGIPGKDAQAFEEAMRATVPELFETQPDLLFQLVTLLPPDQLRKAGVEVYALDQHAGEFVITYPQAYHAGFNHGFNLNEAVNFAPADWEPFGDAGVARLQEFRRQPCFSHDELLLTAAAADTSIKTAKWLAPALQRMLGREESARNEFDHRLQELAPLDGSELENSDMQNLQPPNAVKTQEREDDVENQCDYCKAYTYLSQFRCTASSKVSCLLHTDVVECCSETPRQRLLGRRHNVTYRLQTSELHNLVQKTVDKAGVPESWEKRLEALLESDSSPPLKSMHSLLVEGEKIPYPLQGLESLAEFVRRCDQWVEEANLYLTRKQQNRRKNEKVWRRQSTKGTKIDDKEDEPQLTIERMAELIEEGNRLWFQCPQLENLDEKLQSVNEWQADAKVALRNRVGSAEEIEALLETGRSFMAAMPELIDLETLYQEQKWFEDAKNTKDELKTQTLEQCKRLLARGNELKISRENQMYQFYLERQMKGEFWEVKAREVMNAEIVHYPQLESLHGQVQLNVFPVNPETLAEMEVVLNKNREAHKQIIKFYERSQGPDFRKRPLYTEIRDIMKTLEDLNSKPNGTIDLERELKRHEDWMRKGKKLFGKANAPLHILEVHMKFVEEKNNFCFDLNDTFRAPVEPASREASPTEDLDRGTLGEDEKPVFCICRQPENGMMIMCEICHEWYHSKCLKIARGKMKEFDMFTCPICDWRVKIPRDAARPKLEDLQTWADEMPTLPFQPEEEDLLNRIVDKAQAFRDFLSQFTHGNAICGTSEEMPTILFYLRKLEGAEVLLSDEINLFRQQLHKWQPIAPEPPPVLERSLSTRKPRPTKQQKIMKEMGIENVDDLPQHLRTKTSMKRKNTDNSIGPSRPPLLAAQMQRRGSGTASSRGRSDTPLGMPRQASTGNPPANGHYGPSQPFGHPYGTSTAAVYSAGTPSPMFSPTTSLPSNGLRESLMAPRFPDGPSAGPSPHDPSFHLFQTGFAMGMDEEDDIRTGLANKNGVSAIPEPNEMSSPHSGNVDDIFLSLTNQDADAQNDTTTLEQEPSQAQEALDMIRRASNEAREDGARDRDGAGEDPEKAGFDEFFVDGDGPA